MPPHCPVVRPPSRRPLAWLWLAWALGLAGLLPSPAQAALEVRSVALQDGGQLLVRLDACATPGPLVQVRGEDGAIRLSLSARDLELACSDTSSLPSATAVGEGAWVQDWWVDEAHGVLVLVDRLTRAPRVFSLATGRRERLGPDVMTARLRDTSLWPREQLRALDLAAAWRPLDSLRGVRAVLEDRHRPAVVRLRSAALLAGFGDESGADYVIAQARPPDGPSGLRPGARLTGADLGDLAAHTGGGLLCDRPPPSGRENPQDAQAARQYAIQLLPHLLGFSAVPHLRTLVRSGDPLDRLAVRTALLCLSQRLPDEDPRAARLVEVARWTGGGVGLTVDGPSLRDLEASAGSPDRYVAGQAIRSLLARDDGTESALLRLLARGTPHDGLVALYFATHPSENAVTPLLHALERHPEKSRAAHLLVMALRASVPDEARDDLVAANGASPARWKSWARQRARERRARPDPWALLTSLVPLGLLIARTRERAEGVA